MRKNNLKFLNNVEKETINSFENNEWNSILSSKRKKQIEEVAKNSPEKIITINIDPSVGLQDFQCLQLGLGLGLSTKETRALSKVVYGLYEAFLDNDLSLLEINPLVQTKGGDFVLLDAKCAVDDSSLYRHGDILPYKDYDEMDERDLEANKFGLSYVGLDGSIGCMVNGAGLAMATMDIIKQSGGEPANFLDVGGGASKEVVSGAFKILLADDNVKAILVNIFGGIVQCDVIANGIIDAAKELKVEVPLVVRLQGSNVELGRKLLNESGLAITPADTMEDAASKAVSAAA